MSYTRAHQRPILSPPQSEAHPRTTKVPPVHGDGKLKKSTVSTNGVKTSSVTSSPNKS